MLLIWFYWQIWVLMMSSLLHLVLHVLVVLLVHRLLPLPLLLLLLLEHQLLLHCHLVHHFLLCKELLQLRRRQLGHVQGKGRGMREEVLASEQVGRRREREGHEAWRRREGVLSDVLSKPNLHQVLFLPLFLFSC